MVFFCSPVVCLRRTDGTIKIPEILALIIVPNGSAKLALVLCVPDAFIAGTILAPARVPGVLSNRRRAKISSAIVQAVAIDMVSYISISDITKLTVHKDAGVSASRQSDRALSVKRIMAAAKTPFVPVKISEISRVNNGVLALRKRDSAERIAVAQLSIPKHKENAHPVKPLRQGN